MVDIQKIKEDELTIKIFSLSETEVEKLSRSLWYEDIDKMMKCPVVRFCFFFVTLPIRRARLYFEHPSREIQEFVHDNLIQIRRNLTQDILYGLQYGFIPFEKRFVSEGSQIHYKEFLPIEPKFVQIQTKDGSFDGFKVKKTIRSESSMPWAGEEKIEVEVPAWKSFIFTNEFAFRNYYGKSFLTPAYIPWLLWKETVRLHGHAMSDFVLPSIIARAPEGEGAYNIDGTVRRIRHAEYIMRAAQAARSRSVIYLPPGTDFSIELLQVSRPWDFSKDYEVWEQMIALALLVPRDLFRPGGGSYAKAREQSFWFSQTSHSILQQIVDFVYPFVIVPLIRMNFPSRGRTRKELYGELFFESISARDLEFLQKVATNYLTQAADRPNWEEIFRVLHLPQSRSVSDQPEAELPLTKASIEKSLRKILCDEFHRVKEELGFSDLAVPKFAFEKVKKISNDSAALMEEKSDRRRILSDAIRSVQSLARHSAYIMIGRLLDGSNSDKGSGEEI